MNSITAKGIESLASAVGEMHLTHLNLKNNNIGNDGLKHLENAIPYVQVLNISMRLRLGFNNISSEGGKLLGKIIDKCLTLKTLSIGIVVMR